MRKNTYPDKKHAKLVIASVLFGVSALLFLVYAPNIHFSIPCVFKRITGIPCFGCGLTRAFALASQLRFVEALSANILFLPVAIGIITYFVCALVEVFAGKSAIGWFNSILSKKWIIAIAVVLAGLSWLYNIVHGV